MALNISFKLSGGEAFSLELDPEMTIEDVKALVADQASLDPKTMKLIFKGRILKDKDTISTYGVESGNSMHIVKGVAAGAAAAAPAATSAPAAAAATPAPAAAPINPLGGAGAGAGQPDLAAMIAMMNGGMPPAGGGMGGMGGAGGMGGGMPPAAGGGMGGMGGMPPGMNMNPEQISQMMQNPMVQQMMQQISQDPQMLQQMIQSNPMLQDAMNRDPMMAQMLSNPAVLQQMFNPQNLQMMTAMMQAQQNAGGAGGAPGAGGMPPFGLPPAGGMGGMGMPPMGGGAGMPPAAAAPADNRPAEERYASQIDQLTTMGFPDRASNAQALAQANGDINEAINLLLSGA